jgi:YidC/Oxa1 family membrane protein insertase
MNDNKNLILAIVLSTLIIVGWQFLYTGPQIQQQQQAQQPQQQQQQQQAPTQPLQPPAPGTSPPGEAAADTPAPREQVIAKTPRILIDTPAVSGSLNLRGAQLDDLRLKNYHETVNPSSPTIVLLSPFGAKDAFFADTGLSLAPGTTVKAPTPDTLWTAPAGARLTASTPVTLSYDNGEGFLFRKTFSVDDKFMFTVTQEVVNRSSAPATFFPYARVLRVGLPAVPYNLLLHEGLLGVFDNTLTEVDYDELMEEGSISKPSTGGWLGITDKYWAVAVIPPQQLRIEGAFHYQNAGGSETFQSNFLAKDGFIVAPEGTARVEDHIFAGAKVVNIIEAYGASLGIQRFDLMIDWGYLRFLTKPMFWLLDNIRALVGNFGLAILIVTVLVKLAFFPLANKSYESMSKMKKLQPEMERLKQQYPDDRMALQKEMMALYKKEKVSPVSGCLPVLLQIPVFFALYKVLFVTIEMRHAPFYGWIRDLSAPDPTSLFNLFGLIPWDPPYFLMIGVWPLIMGITMWMQMRLNPTPPDPIQASLFNWMPIIFTFMLAAFPAGLVIYWAWNNLLSIAQQSVIMKRQGVEIDFLGNIRQSLPFLKRKTS